MNPIITERLVIKPMCIDYLESTHEYASDPENTTYMVYLPNDSIEDTRAFLQRAEEEFKKEHPAFYEMAVFYKDVHIGAVSLYLNDDRTVGELGWTINKKYWGHGYAAEAAKGLLDHASEYMGIHKFIATCDTENTASRRVMEKLGMKLVSETGGRRNKQSDEERRQYLFSIDNE